MTSKRREFPPEGWVKLNFDGASKRNPRLARCGGLLRNDNGVWLNGVSME